MFVAAAPGSHSVCAYGVNVASGNANTQLGCKTLTSGAPAPGAAEGLGQRGGYAFEDFALTDRLTAQVNVSSGNLLVTATDLTLAGTGIDLGIGHHYNSRSTQDNAAGRGWTLSGGSGVFVESRADGSKLFHAPTGAVIAFSADGAGGFRAPPDYDAKLESSGSGHALTMTGDKSRWDFDAAGRALSHKDRNNNTIAFAYDASGRLTTMTDTRGRAVNVGYHPSGRIATMDDAASGRRFAYDYDATGRLVTLTAPGVDVITRFEYDGADNMTAVVDPEGRRTTIAYHPDDKVASVTRAGAQAPRTTFAYHAKGAQACVDAGFANANPCTLVSDPRANATKYRRRPRQPPGGEGQGRLRARAGQPVQLERQRDHLHRRPGGGHHHELRRLGPQRHRLEAAHRGVEHL
jgi:YD repeat-containing protein